MKTPVETARRWLAQAEHNLSMARSLFAGSFSAGACFHAEQTAQLALKAYLFRRGRRFVNIHSVRMLLLECSNIPRMLEAGSFVPRGISVDILVYTPIQSADEAPRHSERVP